MRGVCNSARDVGGLGHVLAVTATSGFFMRVDDPTDPTTAQFAFTNVIMENEGGTAREAQTESGLAEGGLADLTHMLFHVKTKTSNIEGLQKLVKSALNESFPHTWKTTPREEWRYSGFLKSAEVEKCIEVISASASHDSDVAKIERKLVSVGDLPVHLHKLTGDGVASMRGWVIHLRAASLSEQEIAFWGSKIFKGLCKATDSAASPPRDFRSLVKQVAEEHIRCCRVDFFEDCDAASPTSFEEVEKLRNSIAEMYNLDIFTKYDLTAADSTKQIGESGWFDGVICTAEVDNAANTCVQCALGIGICTCMLAC